MLNEDQAKSYWEDRAKTHQESAVGFDCRAIEEQDINYNIRTNFIFKNLDTYLPTLDYGCGIGRYAQQFSKYVGADMTKELIKLARKRNKGKRFVHLSHPYLTEVETFNIRYKFDIEQVLTTTVLQHCDDELVIKILKSFKDNLLGLKRLCFYEKDAGDKKPHVISRSTLDYMTLLSEAGIHTNGNCKSHIVHNEKHTLSVFNIQGR
jgi:SAM-dependent methyltransferase